MRLFRGRWILAVAGAWTLIALLNAALGLAALKRLEKEANTAIRGAFAPHLFFPTFTLKDPHLDWQGRFQVLSGTVKVNYDPLFLLPGRGFRIQVEGRGLSVRLSHELAASQGISDVKIDHVKADLAFPPEGPPEIFFFDVRSPELEFSLVKEQTLETEK